jgi:hypothetical protein
VQGVFDLGEDLLELSLVPARSQVAVISRVRGYRATLRSGIAIGHLDPSFVLAGQVSEQFQPPGRPPRIPPG